MMNCCGHNGAFGDAYKLSINDERRGTLTCYDDDMKRQNDARQNSLFKWNGFSWSYVLSFFSSSLSFSLLSQKYFFTVFIRLN